MKSFVRKNKSLFHIVSYTHWFGYDVKIIRAEKKAIVSLRGTGGGLVWIEAGNKQE